MRVVSLNIEDESELVTCGRMRTPHRLNPRIDLDGHHHDCVDPQPSPPRTIPLPVGRVAIDNGVLVYQQRGTSVSDRSTGWWDAEAVT